MSNPAKNCVCDTPWSRAHDKATGVALTGLQMREDNDPWICAWKRIRLGLNRRVRDGVKGLVCSQVQG